MVCKDELCASFKNLRSADRIDLMCELLQLCVPLELRFIASYLEDLARKDYQSLQEFETKANDSVSLRELEVDEPSKDFCGKMNIYVSLLHSDNAFCAHVIFDLLSRLKNVVEGTISQDSSDPHKRTLYGLEMVNDIVLLFTLALHHPAFTFSQRSQLYKECLNLKRLLSESNSYIIPMANGNEVEDKGYVGDEAEDEDSEDQGRNKSMQSTCPLSSSQLDSDVKSVFAKEIALKSSSSTDGKMDFVLEVRWSNSSTTSIVKTYQELCDFDRQFVILFPNYSGVHRQERLLPCLPPENNKRIVELLKDYFRKFSSLPENCLRCDLVIEFFQDTNISSSLSSSPHASATAAVTQSSFNVTSSGSKHSISSRSSDPATASEHESEHRGSCIRTQTFLNSNLAGHGAKRGGVELAGKPLRPHMATAAKAPVGIAGPSPRQPWLNSSVALLQSARTADATLSCQQAGCSSPALSFPRQCTSPRPLSLSSPASTPSTSPVESSQLQNNISESSQKQENFHGHYDALTASSCGKLSTVELDNDQPSQHTPLIHRSKSEQDHKRSQLNNSGPVPSFDSVVGVTVNSATDYHRVPPICCMQPVQSHETPPVAWNSTAAGCISSATPSNIPKGLSSMGLHPLNTYPRPEIEYDISDQDKSCPDDRWPVANDSLQFIEKPQHFVLNSVPVDNSGFNPANVRPYPIGWDSTGLPVYFTGPMVKTGVLVPVSTQTNATTKQARPILGVNHHRTGAKAIPQIENGEKRCAAQVPEAVAMTSKTVTTTTAMITMTTQGLILCDGGQVVEAVGHSSPVPVSSENISRPTSLSVTSVTATNKRSKMNADSKTVGGSNFRVSASRSVAAVSSGLAATGHYSDITVGNSCTFIAPVPVMMQRIPNLPSVTQSYVVPPSISSIAMMHSSPSVTSAIPTPSSTPPVLPPLPPGNNPSNGGTCTSCCQGAPCSMQPLPAVPYGYPIMWQTGLYPNTFGLVSPHNLSYPPPSLQPHLPVGSHFNGISSDIIYSITQPHSVAPVPPPHLNHHPQVMGSPLYNSSQCVPYHPSFPPPTHIQNMTNVMKPKMCCPNCGASDHQLGACTEVKISSLGHTAKFRLNPSTKHASSE